MKRSLLVASAILVGLLAMVGTIHSLACNKAQQAQKCPKFRQPGGLGISDLPSTNDIKVSTFMYPTGDHALAFQYPHCRNCGYVLSRYPISFKSHPFLLSDAEASTIGPTSGISHASNSAWEDLWKSSDNLCDANAMSSPLLTPTDFMTSEAFDTCSIIRATKPSSYDEKVALKDSQGNNYFEVEKNSQYIELKTKYYGMAMYPYSLTTAAEKYSTKMKTFIHRIRYYINAKVTSAANIMTEKQTLVRVNDNNELELDIEFKLPNSYYPISGSCQISRGTDTLLKQDWAMQIDAKKSVYPAGKNELSLSMKSSLKSKTFQGFIEGHCNLDRCTSSSCSGVPVSFKINVDQFGSQESIAETRFTPETLQYTGDDANPFASQVDLNGNREKYVSIGIGTAQSLSGFKSQIDTLRMCSEICTSNSDFDKIVVKDGVIVDQAFANMVGMKLYDNSKMLGYKASGLSGLAPLGFSFLTDAVKSTKYTTWAFEVGMKYTPINSKKRSLTGTLADEVEEETSTFVKTIQLLPNNNEAETGTDVIGVITNGPNAWVNIVIASALVGLCLVCTFSLLFFIGFTIFVQVRRSSKGNTVDPENRHEQLHTEDNVTDVSDASHASSDLLEGGL